MTAFADPYARHEGYRRNKIFRMNRMVEDLYKKSRKSS